MGERKKRDNEIKQRADKLMKGIKRRKSNVDVYTSGNAINNSNIVENRGERNGKRCRKKLNGKNGEIHALKREIENDRKRGETKRKIGDYDPDEDNDQKGSCGTKIEMKE